LDISTILGLSLGFGSVILAILFDYHFEVAQGLGAYLSLPAFFLITGGTFGATVLSFPMTVISGIPNVLKKAFFEDKMEPTETITTMVGFATKARREGLLGLEEDIANITDPFLKKGLQLVVDGTEMEMVRNIMESDLSALEARHKQGGDFFTTLGGFAPTLGIIGTVQGLVHALGEAGGAGGDPGKLVSAIAVAFLATFYGISFANLIFLPIAQKLKTRSEEEVLVKQLQIDGVLSISAGDNPRIVEEKLKAYMPPAVKAQLEAASAAAEGGAK
jgi:chemotaxis protein MotA